MLALAALIGEEAHPNGMRAAVLVGAAITAATLVLARQLSARYEIRTLYRALATKEAESKLTELVRRAAITQVQTTAEMEAVIVTPKGLQRTLFVVGSDQLRNPTIEGITLTLRDVTEQRLSSDIHEGLGQDLTGISLLLKSLENETRRDPNALAGVLKVIVGHVNRTIDTARNLATGLAPMQIARGALDVALTNLAAEARDRFQLRVNLRLSLDDCEIGPGEADHLYRIAREAINNAARHGQCHCIDVELVTEANRFILTVADDGVGIDRETSSGSGLGLRMIGYRARVMGGTMQLGTSPSGGVQISVSAPDAAARGNIPLH